MKILGIDIETLFDKKEREARARGWRIIEDTDLDGHLRWTKETWATNYYGEKAWIEKGEGQRWYRATMHAANYNITCGCFSGTLDEFRKRIDRRPRCPEALRYYESKYKIFEDHINQASPVKA